MPNFETEAKFTEQMRKLEMSDPAHADLFNGIIGELLNNDVFLRTVANQLLLQIQQHISDSQTALDSYYQQSSGYTDRKIADLIGGAPTTLDTLKEIADAIAAHKSVTDALDAAIGRKANAAEFDSHVKDTTAHITEAEINTKLSGKADSGHTHDDRYYTEAEINTKLSGKSDNGHTHNYAAPGHTHSYTEISGRPTFRLDGSTLYIDF